MSPKPPKERLDKLLVERGLCETRSQAQGIILAGNVLLDNQKVDKPGTLCPVDAQLTLKEMPKFVSRGGLKLEKALEEFSVDPTGKICLDVGASSGGFTDCLLKSGAAQVYAVDVGYGQLDWKLRQDPRVVVLEKTHILHLDCALLDPAPNLAVMDVSFISIKKVLSKVSECLMIGPPEEEKALVTLVKPQFEYRDYCVIKGFNGVVTDAGDHEAILLGLAKDVMALLPAWQLVSVTASPLKGPKGNREFFFYLRQGPSSATHETRWETLVETISQLAFNDS